MGSTQSIPGDDGQLPWLCRRIALGVLSFLVLINVNGCGHSFQTVAEPPKPRGRPAVGPWFVDHAREYCLDVITRCGSLRKTCVTDSIGSGVALFDFDGDGDLDIFVTACSKVVDGVIQCAGGPWLFRNDGTGAWTDVTADSGLTHKGWAQAVAVSDYDGDGDLDLFIAQLGPDILWQNQGDGRFLDITSSAGLTSENLWGIGATWGDADGDGWPDLYVTNYLEVDPTDPPPPLEYKPGIPVFAGPTTLTGQPDTFWRNRGNGTFEDATATSGFVQPTGKGMAALFDDFDNDGKLDLFVTNDTQANDYFRNIGGGKFVQEGETAGVSFNGKGMPEGSMGIDAADLDGDGLLDLAYANFRHEGTRIYRNIGKHRFEDVSTGSFVNVNTQRFVGWGIVLADFDDDGWPDLFQANGHVYPNVPDSDYAQPPIFLRNQGNGRFERVTDAWGPDLETNATGGRSVAAGDLDGDGDLDLVMTTMDGPLRVLINEGTRSFHTLTVQLGGPHPNTEALGARVEIEAGGRTFHAQVRRGGSFMAAPDVSLHFGLGSATDVSSITVHWPNAGTSKYESLPVDTKLIIHHGASKVRSIPFAQSREISHLSEVQKP